LFDVKFNIYSITNLSVHKKFRFSKVKHGNICDTGAQNPSFVVFDFFIESYSTLHLLQNTFYSIKISCF